MSKEYWVALPIAGVITVNINADNKDEAIEKALLVEWDIDFSSKTNTVELDEIDIYERLVTGNVVHAPLWEADAEEA